MRITYLKIIIQACSPFVLTEHISSTHEMTFGVPMMFWVSTLLVAVQLLPILSKCTAQ